MNIKNIKRIRGILRIKKLAKRVIALTLLFTSIDVHIDGCGVSISVSFARRTRAEEPGKKPD